MPRDASGNYTLPAGNPVVTGTTIDSSWANNTMDDIAAAIQDSLSRSGDGGMLVAFKNADGNVSAPGITFTNELTSGFYRADTNDIRVTIAGSDRVRFRASTSDPFQFWDGSQWRNVLNEGSNIDFVGNVTFGTGTLALNNGVSVTGNIVVSGTVDGRDVAADGTKLDGIEAAADVTDATNVAAAGAAMLASTATFTGLVTLDADVTVADFGTGGRVKDGLDTARPVGFNVLPLYEIDAADSFDLAHNGMLWHTDGASTIAFTCDNDANIPVGAMYTVVNESSSGVQTIAQGAGVTLRWFDGSTTGGQTGTRTLASGGVANVYKYSDTEFFIWGNGLS